MPPSFKKSPPSSPASTPASADHKSSFEIAAERARARHSAEMWAQLAPGERSQAIYDELRRIDEEAAQGARRPT